MVLEIWSHGVSEGTTGSNRFNVTIFGISTLGPIPNLALEPYRTKIEAKSES